MLVFFFQAEDGIRDLTVTGVQTCALPIYVPSFRRPVQLEEGPLDLRDDAPVEPGMNGKGLWRDLFSPRENGEFLALRRIERIETPGDDAGGHRLAVEDRPERRIVRARVNCLDLVRRHASAGEVVLHQER